MEYSNEQKVNDVFGQTQLMQYSEGRVYIILCYNILNWEDLMNKTAR